MQKRLLVFVVLLAILFGCNPQDLNMTPKHENSSTSKFDKSSPAVSLTTLDGTVYIGSYDGYLYAVDAATGAQRWKAKTKDAVVSSPTVANGSVYVGSANQVYSFDELTGATKWMWESTTLGAWTISSPIVYDGKVYIGMEQDALYALDAINGNVVWKNKALNSIESSPTIDTSTSGIIDGAPTLYVGNGYDLCAVNSVTGFVHWSANTGGFVESSPAVASRTVYVGSYNNSFSAFDSITGSLIWKVSTGHRVQSSPTVVNGIAYVGCHDMNLYAFDASNGNIRWQAPMRDYISSSPQVDKSTVYVGCYDGAVHAYDALTGFSQWTTTLSSGIDIHSSPTVAFGTLYIGSEDNNLYALDAASGSILWSSSTGAGIRSSPCAVFSTDVYHSGISGEQQ